jgi:DNA adenine methylase
VIEHFPPHKWYVEPFGGAASVLIRKQPSLTEIYNDVSDVLFNFFSVLREPELRKRLIDLLTLTPVSRLDFERCIQYEGDDPVELARAFFVVINLGRRHSWETQTKGGFETRRWKSSANTSHNFQGLVANLAEVAARFRDVILEHEDAFKIIDMGDSPDTLFYCDPPYPASTRTHKHEYASEMTDLKHKQLADKLHSIEGKAVLSGYSCELLDNLYKDWKRYDISSTNLANQQVVESIWVSPNTNYSPNRRALLWKKD